MDISKVIEKAYDAGASDFGIRAMTGGKVVAVGESLENSYHWEDGISTGVEIDGTCAIGFRVELGEIDQASFEKAVAAIKDYADDGVQVVVIAGNLNIDECFNDHGEVVIKDAVCVAVL